MVVARLIVQVKNQVRIEDLGSEPATIGREKSNAIRIDDRTLSRYHCRIEPHRSGYRLVDLGSQNGTLVNGSKVSKKVLA
ncbi:MAG: FHA domain-containing protein, partial [Planctomycetota bacterium]